MCQRKKYYCNKKLLATIQGSFRATNMAIKLKDRKARIRIEKDKAEDWLYLFSNSFNAEKFCKSISRIVALEEFPPSFVLKHSILGKILFRNLVLAMIHHIQGNIYDLGCTGDFEDICSNFILFYNRYNYIFDPLFDLNSQIFYYTLLVCFDSVKDRKGDSDTKRRILQYAFGWFGFFLNYIWDNIKENLEQLENTVDKEDLKKIFTEIALQEKFTNYKDKNISINVQKILSFKTQLCFGGRDAERNRSFFTPGANLKDLLKSFGDIVGREEASEVLSNEVVRDNFIYLLEHFKETKNSDGLRRVFYFLYKSELQNNRELYYLLTHQSFQNKFFGVFDCNIDFLDTLGLFFLFSDKNFINKVILVADDIEGIEDMFFFLSDLALRFKYDQKEEERKRLWSTVSVQDDESTTKFCKISDNEEDRDFADLFSDIATHGMHLANAS